jgi:hypothetical protein
MKGSWIFLRTAWVPGRQIPRMVEFAMAFLRAREASGFMAECVLFNLDSVRLTGVRYFRYVDDIRLMAQDEPAARRALLRLDLESKKLGSSRRLRKLKLAV